LLQALRFLVAGFELLLESLDLLVALVDGLAGLGKFVLQLVAVASLVFEREAHRGVEVIASRRRHLIRAHGRHVHGPGDAVIRDVVNVHRGESQEAYQEEVADDDEDAAVHTVAATRAETGA
jgi:hypothetical protein